MVRLEQAVIMSREAQTSDTALFRKDLPKSGAYSALDIGIRLTNGSTSAVNLDILDVIKHISLVCNGNDYRFHLKGQDFFRLDVHALFAGHLGGFSFFAFAVHEFDHRSLYALGGLCEGLFLGLGLVGRVLLCRVGHASLHPGMPRGGVAMG